MDIILVHGYNVTSTRTYGVLPHRLKSLGYSVKNVYLSKYVTLDNDVRLPDIIKAFHAALQDIYGSQFEKRKFACITHSTGGLVVRGWIDQYYSRRMRTLPLSHLIMLAPSRLASLGKSRLSRLREMVGIEPGIQILNALELASPTQWQLNSAWIEKKLHAAPGFYPVVITGQWIDKKLWDVVVPATYERGSDGVVRASSANLNMNKFTVEGDKLVKKEVMGGIPYLIPQKISHADTRYGIMRSIPKRGHHPVLSAIVAALKVKGRRAYNELEAKFALDTTLMQRRDSHYDGSPLQRYSQLFFCIKDNMGNFIDDYAIELLDGEGRGDQFPRGFFGHEHRNQINGSFFIFCLNYDKIAQAKGKKIGFRVTSVPNSPLFAYKELVFNNTFSEVGKFLKPNQTTMVDVILQRRINKKVFRLTKNHTLQKITRDPGPLWIN